MPFYTLTNTLLCFPTYILLRSPPAPHRCPHLLQEVPLARRGLGHLPARWQRDIIRYFKGRLAEVLRGGGGGARDDSRGGQRGGRHGAQLQGGWGGVGADVLWGQGPRSAGISTGLQE